MYQFHAQDLNELLAASGHYLVLDVSGRMDQCTHNLHQADVAG